ncbi:OmpA family protein [Pseudodesulfovibrio sp. JC047]|uniref:OmpA family protein n=1 Tax=Pseudodesulfovibrio sp. JC047 TaxID=2683199 RepID=UPI0013CF9FE1|nr:OmpA family protein [Pseudodesulfovibrio sp. JC047]NDV17899.1 OmpA family protein [Pseudodesulfovibrio sp. JC047]
MKKVLLFALLLTVSACANVDLSLTDQTKIYTDPSVRKSPLQVSVHPKGTQHRPLTAYFYPFIIQQQTSDHASLAHSFAQIFYSAWAEERLFPIMEMQPGTRYQGMTSALETARRRGADLLVLGKVPYFYAGHTVDDTAITIQLDIYAAGSGVLLWTMMQSGRLEERPADDYFYFKHEFRMSEAPFNMIIRAIAKDMTIPLKAWLPSPDTQYPYVETPTQVKPALMEQAHMSKNQDALDPGHGVALPPDVTPATVVRPHVPGVDLNIQFDFDKISIQQKSYPLLDALSETLTSPELRGRHLIVGGHSDASGNAAYNQTLSKKRAEAVKTYLVTKGRVNPALIETIGYGQSRPLNQGKTPEEQRQNRRVEIRLADQAGQ